MSTWWRRWPVVLVAVLLVAWPLTYRYSSLGLDVETPRGESVESRFYRMRWPGDGSVWVGWIDQQLPADEAAWEMAYTMVDTLGDETLGDFVDTCVSLTL